MKSLFPTMIAGLSLFAAIIYFFCGDFGRGIYWLSAALLSFSTTFWIH